MRQRVVKTLLIISVPVAVLHIFSLFILPVRSVGFAGILLSVMLLLGHNIFAWRFEAYITRRFSREADYESWRMRRESAAFIEQRNVEQQRKMYKIHHDLYNHIAAVTAMLRENDLRGASEYLERLGIRIRGGE